ncbi:hypothetical protein BH09DEP1_BH09DEP1_1750 [soil metagenome]
MKNLARFKTLLIESEQEKKKRIAEFLAKHTVPTNVHTDKKFSLAE